MTTARQRRGNSNGETESSGNGTFMGHDDEYFAGGRCTRGSMAAAKYSTSFSAPSSSSGFCEGIRAGQMQPVDTETTAEAFD